MTDAQNGKLRALYGEVGIRGRPAQLAAASALLGIGPISTHNELDVGQTSRLIDTLTAVDNGYLELVVDDQGDVVGTRPAEPQDATDG